YGVAADNAGNVYSTGIFTGTVDMDPGPGVFNLTSTGANDYDAYVSKLGASGNFIWAYKFGGTSYEYGLSIALDKAGFIYIAGWFGDTVDFDPGPSTYNLISAGGADVFVSKSDAAGNFVWAKRMGSAGDVYKHDMGYSLTIDAGANILITGNYTDTADFDPGPGVFNLISAGTHGIFACKLDSSGNFIWAKGMSGSGSLSMGYGISQDVSGNVYVTGSFLNTIDFDPGPGIFNMTSIPGTGGMDVFVVKLNSSGNFVWAKQWGEESLDEGWSVITDAAGNIYTTGRFSGNQSGPDSVDFDPGPGVYNIFTPGLTASPDIFISKLDSSGNFVWAKAIGGGDADYGFSITMDLAGDLYITGTFAMTVDFDPGPGTFNLTANAGSWDPYILKMSPSGNFTWAKQLRSSGSNSGQSIVLDSLGNIYLTGHFSMTCDFDPGTGIFNLTSGGGMDGFVLKLGISPNNIEENLMINGINIYPNPVADYLYFSKTNQQNIIVRVFDRIGKKVLDQITPENKIYLGNLSTGIYSVLFYDEKNNQSSTARIMKN
ncbi:MAG TPA: T9SS type A sorting domain-containing protein, partial [Bacteroidia bacterium]|nr:T9SS type A sorting domain-containing protein [Bacteroidia bacterium]